jgi:pathogenesis-related protein 1
MPQRQRDPLDPRDSVALACGTVQRKSSSAKFIEHVSGPFMNPRCRSSAVLILAAAGCGSPSGQPPSASAPAAAATPAAAVAANTALPATGMSPQDINAVTAHHNKVRADVGVAPLKWSSDIAAYAQQWAEQLALSGCKMKHRSPNAYGENLFQGTFGAYTAVDASKAWVTEKKDYAGGVLTESNWAPAGHYTQMVWRQTTRLGCGQAICGNTLIVACNYDPPGNLMGRRPY